MANFWLFNTFLDWLVHYISPNIAYSENMVVSWINVGRRKYGIFWSNKGPFETLILCVCLCVTKCSAKYWSPYIFRRPTTPRSIRSFIHSPRPYSGTIWVRFCRTGKIPVLLLYFLKLEASCDQTWWDIFSFSIDPGQLGLVASKNTLTWPWKKFFESRALPLF